MLLIPKHSQISLHGLLHNAFNILVGPRSEPPQPVLYLKTEKVNEKKLKYDPQEQALRRNAVDCEKNYTIL